MKNILLFSLSLSMAFPQASGQFTLTPVTDLGMHDEVVEVPAKFASNFPANKVVKLPPGWKARVFFAGGLNKPRFMSFSPEGVLHVTDMGASGTGKVYALPDANHDGIADTVITVSSGYTNNHDVKFYNGNMYVTETYKVWKNTDADHDGIYEIKSLFIDTIANGAATGGHFTRTIVFDSVNHKLYLSVGSSCNVCRETRRAIIEQYNDDGTGRRTFATGTRNAVGMTMHPATNRLWANNNGSDWQGNEIPPEWIDMVRDGGFYGHPFAYADKQWFDFDAHPNYQALKPITAADSANVQKMILPAALIRAHSAPMAIQFLNSSFPNSIQKGFLMAVRGSWNTTAPNDFRGYKVIYGDLSTDQDTTVNFVADFCSGFLVDTAVQNFWGRPVGLAVDHQGNVFMTSDEGNQFVLMIYPENPQGINEPVKPMMQVRAAYPNPFRDKLTVPFSLDRQMHVTVALFDLLGRQINTFQDGQLKAGDYTYTYDMGQETGFYMLKVKAGMETHVQKVSCVK